MRDTDRGCRSEWVQKISYFSNKQCICNIWVQNLNKMFTNFVVNFEQLVSKY